MTMNSGGPAINFSQVKAIKPEIFRQAANRIFEFINIILSVVNEETVVLKIKSFAHDGVAYYFNYKSIFRLCFLRIVDKVNKQKLCL